MIIIAFNSFDKVFSAKPTILSCQSRQIVIYRLLQWDSGLRIDVGIGDRLGNSYMTTLLNGKVSDFSTEHQEGMLDEIEGDDCGYLLVRVMVAIIGTWITIGSAVKKIRVSIVTIYNGSVISS